jgi:hypothetical protein
VFFQVSDDRGWMATVRPAGVCPWGPEDEGAAGQLVVLLDQRGRPVQEIQMTSTEGAQLGEAQSPLEA